MSSMNCSQLAAQSPRSSVDLDGSMQRKTFLFHSYMRHRNKVVILVYGKGAKQHGVMISVVLCGRYRKRNLFCNLSGFITIVLFPTSEVRAIITLLEFYNLSNSEYSWILLWIHATC
jgi:hypothetical protein